MGNSSSSKPFPYLKSDRLSQGLLRLRWRAFGRVGYFLLALFTAVMVSVGSIPASQALSIGDLLRGGVQVLQGWQLTRMSDAQETELGQQINESILTREFQRYDNPTLNAYIDQIGQRLGAQSNRSGLRYTFQVVNSNEVNAFATMGGFVYVTTGLLKTAENEAELAGVLGHEIGHIEGKHLIKQIWQSAWQQGLLTATGLDRNTAAQLGVELALNRPNSREHEHDADDRGLRIMGNAGYAQVGMASFMRKLMALGGSSPAFLSTHPSTSSRVRDIEGRISPEKRNGDGLDTTAYRTQIQALL
jgi:predicted Zn-dependent protease